MTSFLFFKYFDAFELDVNVVNFLYYRKTRLIFLGNNIFHPPSVVPLTFFLDLVQLSTTELFRHCLKDKVLASSCSINFRQKANFNQLLCRQVN